MKKNLGLLVLGLILILNLFGCGKREEVKEEVPVDISTGDNISGDNKNLDSSGSKDSNIITNTEIKKDISEEKIIKESSEISENNFPKLPKNWKELSEEALAEYLPECEFVELQPSEITNIDDVVQNCTTEEKKGYLGIIGESQYDLISFYKITKNGKILEIYNILKDKGNFSPKCAIKDKGNIMILGEGGYSYTVNDYTILQAIVENKKIYEKYMHIINILPTPLEEKLLAIKDFCVEECKDFKFRVAREDGNNYILGGLRNKDGIAKISDREDYFVYLINDRIYSPGKNKHIDLTCSNNSCKKGEVYYIRESRRFFSGFSGNNLIIKKMTNGIPLINQELTFTEYGKHTAYWHHWNGGIKDNPFIKYNLKTCEIKLD